MSTHPTPPDFLDADGLAEWTRVLTELEARPGGFDALLLGLLNIYAASYGTWQDAARHVAVNGASPEWVEVATSAGRQCRLLAKDLGLGKRPRRANGTEPKPETEPVLATLDEHLGLSRKPN